MHFGKNITYECCQSQSVSALEMVPAMLRLREKCLWRNGISFKKDAEKVALLQVKERLDTNFCRIQG